ncbi:MAG: hypothetical protein ACREN6_12335 [Gemmatimonadaceae bacterium]
MKTLRQLRNPMLLSAAVASIVVVCASTASAQAGARPGAAPSAAALIAGWPATDRGEATAVLDSARDAGLPVAPLRAKIAEGIAKDAPPATIVNVVRRLYASLRTARQTLGTRIGEPELVAAAAALQSGVAPAQLRALRVSISADRSATELFVVLTDLTHRGVTAEESVGALTRLARAGANDATLVQLRFDVAKDVAAGVPAQSAVSRRTNDYVSRGLPPPEDPVPPPAPDGR